MRLIEIFAILVGLLVGYFAVSKLIGTKPDPQPQKPNPNANPNANQNQNQNTSSQPPPREEEENLAWYEVLKVSPHASADEIHSAYKSQIRQYHPDKVASLGPEIKALAESKSKAINRAYQEGVQARQN
jgi:DnaJ like chaperone protein